METIHYPRGYRSQRGKVPNGMTDTQMSASAWDQVSKSERMRLKPALSKKIREAIEGADPEEGVTIRLTNYENGVALKAFGEIPWDGGEYVKYGTAGGAIGPG